MSPRTVTTSINVTAIENVQFSALAAKFGLKDDQLVEELVRYGLNLAGETSPVKARNISEFLEARADGRKRMLDSIRLVLARIEESARVHEMLAGLLAGHIAELPPMPQLPQIEPRN